MIVSFMLILGTRSWAEDKLPIPEQEERAKAREVVREVFGAELSRANTPATRLSLSRQLCEEAQKPGQEPAGRFALFVAASDIAPDAKAAIDVVDAKAEWFKIDVLKEKASTLVTMSTRAKTGLENKIVANAVVDVIASAMEADDYDMAVKLCAIGSVAAGKAQDGKLVREIGNKATDARERKAQFDAVQVARAILDKTPTQPRANSVVGEYTCFIRADWATGLSHLALGDNDALKKLALEDLQKPASGDKQLQLADNWHELASKSVGKVKEGMLQRALFWYGSSLRADPPLSRLAKAKAMRRIEGLSPSPREYSTIPADAKKFEDHYYKAIESSVTWEQARRECQRLGGYLVRIESSAEQTFVFDLMRHPKEAGYYWADGTDDDLNGEWVFGNGKTLSFTYWDRKQPKGGRDSEGRAHNRISLYTTSGRWHDAQGKLKCPFICEWESLGSRPGVRPSGSTDATQGGHHPEIPRNANTPVAVPATPRVTLVEPYPQSYPGAATDKITVQYAVMEMAKQAGRRYDFQTSLNNTNPVCRQWIRPNIRNQSYESAIAEILQPLGLSYEEKDGVIALKRR
ncbi:MAG: C-type lectin domain-containing protein [Planctomycetes bacterium]|nr:C-type lectin domain-containing protein [Planctomycetota bacterium]